MVQRLTASLHRGAGSARVHTPSQMYVPNRSKVTSNRPTGSSDNLAIVENPASASGHNKYDLDLLTLREGPLHNAIRRAVFTSSFGLFLTTESFTLHSGSSVVLPTRVG